MCPGARWVAAASEAGRVVTNGMSDYARAGANANSALLVGGGPGGLRRSSPGGRGLPAALGAGGLRPGRRGYRAPAQLVGIFWLGGPRRAGVR